MCVFHCRQFLVGYDFFVVQFYNVDFFATNILFVVGSVARLTIKCAMVTGFHKHISF